MPRWFSRKGFQEISTSYHTSIQLIKMLWYIDKQLFLTKLGATAIPGILPFVDAYIYKLIIDLIVRHLTTHVPFDYHLLIVLIGTRTLSLVLQDIVFSLQTYLDQLLWYKVPSYLYQAVMGKLINLDVSYFENSAFRDKLEKVRDAYQWRPLNMVSALFYGFQTLLQMVVALFAIATLNPLFIFLVLLITVPSFINQARYEKITWGIWGDESPTRKRFYYITDLIQWGQSIKEIKIFQIGPKLLAELKSLYQSFTSKNIKVAKKQFISNLFLNIYGVLVYIGIEIYAILAALGGKITIGDVSYYTSVITNFQAGLSGTFRNITQIFSLSLYVREVFSLLDVSSNIKVSERAIIVDSQKAPLIEFKNITFSYPDSEKPVFQNFSFIIHPGEKVAFVGENGAGKTTFVKLLARFYDVTSGEILINGINIKDIELSSWYKTLGVLFQDFIRYEFSLSDNIYFGKVYEDKQMREIIQAAKESGADEVAETLPKKYDQILGRTFEGGEELSTGQWQKVALARAFLRGSPVLILDEPTASIDAKAESEIFQRVEKLSQDKTVIIISHRFSTVRNADHIYVIDQGKIKESGSHEELMKRNGTYATLFNLQAKGYQ